MSIAYPFLAIARRFGLPYGEVVRLASLVDGSEVNGVSVRWMHEQLGSRRADFLVALHAAIGFERQRRQADVG